MWRHFTHHLRALTALAVAMVFILAAAAAPPETVLSSPGPDQLAAPADTSSLPGDQRNDRQADASVATSPSPLVLPIRTPDGNLTFLVLEGSSLPGHRERIDRPPRAHS